MCTCANHYIMIANILDFPTDENYPCNISRTRYTKSMTRYINNLGDVQHWYVGSNSKIDIVPPDSIANYITCMRLVAYKVVR